jgi:hypothetical protein
MYCICHLGEAGAYIRSMVHFRSLALFKMASLPRVAYIMSMVHILTLALFKMASFSLPRVSNIRSMHGAPPFFSTFQNGASATCFLYKVYGAHSFFSTFFQNGVSLCHVFPRSICKVYGGHPFFSTFFRMASLPRVSDLQARLWRLI